MPTYEYECTKCLARFEVKKRFSDNGPDLCPTCGREARRLFSPVPIIFKGPGFYVTDSRKDHDRPSGESKSELCGSDKKKD